MQRFAYLGDPLFIGCLAVYAGNRWLLKPLVIGGFCHTSLNDLICIPFWVPVMLWAMRRTGLRAHDGPPEWQEVAVPLVVWSALFELWLPLAGPGWRRAVADPADVFWYAVGGVAAAGFWRWRYRTAAPLKGG